MDTITMKRDGKIIGSSMKENLSDQEDDLGNKISIKAKNGRMLVLGMAKEKIPFEILVHGNISCDKESCIVDESQYLSPSLSSMNVMRSARTVLNNYILSFDDVRMKGSIEPSSFPNVREMKIEKDRDQFRIMINSERRVDVDRFLLDPLIVNEVSIDGMTIEPSLDGANCSIVRRENGFDHTKTMLCSKGTMRKDAEEIKSYFSARQEQVNTTRRMSFSKRSTMEVMMASSRSPSCFIRDGTMCCVYGDGEKDEVSCFNG